MGTEVEKIDIDALLEDDDLSGVNDRTSEFQIKYWSYSRSVKELVEMYQNGEIIIPSLQRDYVWTYEQASLFIDSILRGLPIPSFFITQIGSKYLMIDGLQRLHTLRLFYSNQPYDGWKKRNAFRLSNSSSISYNFRGKTYQELDTEHQTKFLRTMMSLIEFNQVSPSNNYSAMFQIFQRINSTGRVLTAQEVRNAAFYSSFSQALNKNSENEVFVGLYNCQSDAARTEMLLRFMAIDYLYRHKERFLHQHLNLKLLLNEFMAVAQARDLGFEITDDAFPHFAALFEDNSTYGEHFERFGRIVEEVKKNLGDLAFHNIRFPIEGTPQRRRSLNPVLAEEIMVAFGVIVDQSKPLSPNAQENMMALLAQPEFQESISAATMRFDGICERVEKVLNALTNGTIL